MTRALPRACSYPACPEVQPCPVHARKAWATTTTSRHKRGYDWQWTKARNRYAKAHPWCEWPGCAQAMVDVDHIVPLAAGGARLDTNNMQSLCTQHHKEKTKRDAMLYRHVQ